MEAPAGNAFGGDHKKTNRKSKFTTKDLVGSGSDGEATGVRSRYFARTTNNKFIYSRKAKGENKWLNSDSPEWAQRKHLSTACDGQYIEQIGIYDPASDPKVVRIDAELAKKWLANGAQPTDTVRNLFKEHGIL